MFLCFLQVNLRYGVLNPLSRTGTESDTCTACAGTMILEFAALSRLSGESVFEVLFFVPAPLRSRPLYVPFCSISPRLNDVAHESKQSLSDASNRPMRGRLWTFCGRGGRKEATWWGPSSISTVKNGCGGVRDRSNAGNNRPASSPLRLVYPLACRPADSGVGAGIDSYYEYLMKAYILLGDDVFLQRFNTVSPP